MEDLKEEQKAIEQLVQNVNTEAMTQLSKIELKEARRKQLNLKVPSEIQILECVKKHLESEFPEIESKSEEKEIGYGLYARKITKNYLIDPESKTEIFVTESSPRKKTFKRFIQMKMTGGYAHQAVTDLKVRRLKDIEMHLDGMIIELYNNRAEAADKIVEISKEQVIKEKLFKRFQDRHEGAKIRVDYVRMSNGCADVHVEYDNPAVRIQYRISGLNTKQWKIHGLNTYMNEIPLKNFFITVRQNATGKGEGKEIRDGDQAHTSDL